MPAKVRTTEQAHQAQARKAEIADQKKAAVLPRIDDQTNDAKALASKIERLRALRLARDEELARQAPPPLAKKTAKTGKAPKAARSNPPRPVLTKADIE